jgi:signal transduction histidine kinase
MPWNLKSNNWNVLIIDSDLNRINILRKRLIAHTILSKSFFIQETDSIPSALAILEKEWIFEIVFLNPDISSEKNTLYSFLYNIEKKYPSFMRIILIFNEIPVQIDELIDNFNIESYLLTEDIMTPRFFLTINNSLNNTRNTSTILALGSQMNKLALKLPNIKKVETLLQLITDAIAFLDFKHTSRSCFIYDIEEPTSCFLKEEDCYIMDIDKNTIISILNDMHNNYLHYTKLYEGGSVNLPTHFKILLFQCPLQTTEQVQSAIKRGALLFNLQPGYSRKMIKAYIDDAAILIENWCIAYESLILKQKLEQEKLLRENIYYERLESLAVMVTGVAHEMNTPLGVAKTSTDMIRSLIKDYLVLSHDDSDLPDIKKDILTSCSLLERNICKAYELIKSFKQLSTNQLREEYDDFNLVNIINDCIINMSPELKKNNIETMFEYNSSCDYSWKGYAGYFYQVFLNLISNIIRYAYDKSGGKVAIKLDKVYRMYTIKIEDFGKGIPPNILPHIFVPFVTTGRKIGGTGLGLAISHNIIVNIFKGSIKCESSIGKGTIFLVKIPEMIDKQTESTLPDYAFYLSDKN